MSNSINLSANPVVEVHQGEKATIMVGLSGGVDSSVAALLLKQQGYRVEGLFMKNWEEDDADGYCAAAEDLRDAQAVADRLSIPLHSVNFSSEYWDRVFAYFLSEYRRGRTPNPDVLCNREIKFKAFLDHALSLGAQYIATGHYAAIRRDRGYYRLFQAADPDKDQTYFLYMLGQQALAQSLFPLAGLTKPEVRRLAAAAGFINHRKKDSTGICFIGERRFRDFLSRYLPALPGDIVTSEGKLVGRHQGVMYYTLGQRRGLGIGGVEQGQEAPWFVAAKDLRRNQLIVVQGHDHPALFSKRLSAEQLHWTTHPPDDAPFSCRVRCRHRQPLQKARCKVQGERMLVEFQQPQRAVTPGQSVVLYLGTECIGGGIISSSG